MSGEKAGKNKSANSNASEWQDMGQEKSGQKTSWEDLSKQEQTEATERDMAALYEALGRQEERDKDLDPGETRVLGVVDDFAGERDFNDGNQKKRSSKNEDGEMHDFDAFPRQKGESNEEYGERLRKIHQLEKVAKEKNGEKASSTKDYLGSDPRHKAYQEYWDLQERLRKAKERKEAQSPKTSEAEPDNETLDQKEVDKIDEIDEILEKKEQLAEEELDILERQKQELEKEEQKIKERLGEEEDEPLVAINADFTYDKEALAKHYAAERSREDEHQKGPSGFIRGIWKGNLFKKYYQMKYEKEYLSGQRTVDVNGEELTVEDLVEQQSDAAIKRFVMGVTEEYGDTFVHKEAGESLTKADEKTTKLVRTAIEEYATAKLGDGKTLEDLDRDFSNTVMRMKKEAEDKGETVDETLIDNYVRVAQEARKRVEHGRSIDQVMHGFAVYNAEARNGLRTDEYRDHLDRIIEKIETSKVGRYIPPEAIAVGIGVVSCLSQTGVRAALGAAFGIGFSGVAAALKERNKVTADRALMMRNIASGGEYKDTHNQYEVEMGGTIYDMRGAAELTENLQNAMEEGNRAGVLSALAEAKVRRSFSDAEAKDLIAYSAEDKIGEERLALDVAIARAMSELSDEEKTVMTESMKAVESRIDNEVDQNDTRFKILRRRRAMKKGLTTAGFGALFFLGSQEAMAIIDPNTVGVLEKGGLVNTQNTENARETILASLMPGKYSVVVPGVSASDEKLIQQLEDAGYKRRPVNANWTSQQSTLADVSPNASPNRLKVVYDGWAGNNTPVADGNELRVFLQDGQMVSGMTGDSMMGSQIFNYETEAAAGHIKGILTVGGEKFDIVSKLNEAGQMTWGDGGVFTTTTGETIKAIGQAGEKLYEGFEVVIDRGVDAAGAMHMIPMASDFTGNTFGGTVQQVVEQAVSHPATFDFFKPITGATMTRGLFLPFVGRRRGLGAAERTGRTIPANRGEGTPTEGEEIPTEAEETPAGGETSSEGGGMSGEAGEEMSGEGQKTDNELWQEEMERIRGQIGDEGYKMMTSTEAYAKEDDAKYQKLWDSLSDASKAIMRFNLDRRDIPGAENRALGIRGWLAKLDAAGGFTETNEPETA